jgi:hypothetical protein
MKSTVRIFLIVVMTAGLAVTAACNDEDQLDETGDTALLTKMEAEIDDFIGEPTCKDAKDCRAIAFGAKPCGGPWSYKIFSASAVDTTELFTLVDDYNELNATFNDRHGWMSDCSMVERPGIECLEGRCVAIEPAKAESVE